MMSFVGVCHSTKKQSIFSIVLVLSGRFIPPRVGLSKKVPNSIELFHHMHRSKYFLTVITLRKGNLRHDSDCPYQNYTPV